MKKRKKSSGKNRLFNLLIAVIIVVGVALIVYPGFSDWWNNLHQSRAVAAYVEKVADLSKEEYDSMYLIHPYDDEDVIRLLPYKMSQELREEISYTLDDTFVRIVFIDNDTVKAYTEIGNWSAYFATPEITNHGPIFSFEQRFILDENRYVHIYEE